MNEMSDMTARPPDLPHDISVEVSLMGIPKRLRQKRFRNVRMQQIATLLSMHARVVPGGRAKRRASRDMGELFERIEENRELLPLLGESATAGASLEFVRRLTEEYALVQNHVS